MSLTRIPLPSIALVLTSDHAALPSRPSVIKFEFDPLQTIHPTSSGRSRVLDLDGDQTGELPAVDERFFFHTIDGSSTNVGNSDGEPLDDELDAETMFSEKRPTTSRGPKSKGLTSDVVFKDNLRALASVMHSLLLQLKPKGSAMIKSTYPNHHGCRR